MTIVGDPNFPFPAPDWIMIHRVTLKRVLTVAPDARGKSVVTYDTDIEVAGYLTGPDRNNEDSAGTERIRYSAVLLVPNDVCVKEDTLVRCNDPQLPPTLAGTYKVEASRPNLSHTRCLLTRYTGPWEKVS